MRKFKNICVFCSSSSSVDRVYFEKARELGKYIAFKGYNLVYGGANVGLMNEIALSVKENRGRVYGVIPKIIYEKGLLFAEADEIVITEDLRERKKILEEKSDVFVVLPGGFGTIDEMAEVISLKQLSYHSKPIVLYNINDFFNPIHLFFKDLINKSFVKPDFENIYYIANNLDELFQYIDNYIPPSYTIANQHG